MKNFFTFSEIERLVSDKDARTVYNYIEYLEGIRRDKTYGLVWEREKEDFETVLKDHVPILESVFPKDITTDVAMQTNLLIEGDNLHALKILEQTHCGKVDAIYIDPPFNTGAKDWKYNNAYVDKENVFRHSKWICMMEKRIRIAKKLLKSDGVFICAIDENELASLWLLLEEVFSPGYAIDCVTIVHNPRGVQGNNFSYTNEYALFVYKKGSKVIENREIELEEIEWSNFRNWGDESLRHDARNCFYPVLVKDGQIIGFGDDITNTDIHPKQTEYDEETGIYSVYPIDTSGTEHKWRYERGTVEGIQHLLRVKQRDGYFEIELGKDFESYKTVWTDKRYDANEYGTKILKSMVPGSDFDYPKSVYNVMDCLLAVVKNRPDAVILDFFAGSGTTAHAVQLINKQYGGHRHFILCTNNAVGYKREKEYIKKNGQIDTKSAKWTTWCEKYGIASSITYPRITSLYNGYMHSGAIKTTLLSKKIGLTQLKDDRLFKRMQEIANEHSHEYDEVKLIVDSGIAQVIGITNKQTGVEGIPANLKYYKCSLIPKESRPRRTLAKLENFLDAFIQIKEDAYEAVEHCEYKEFKSTFHKKQVFVYQKSFVDESELGSILHAAQAPEVVLYVNEAIINDEYLTSLKSIRLMAIPRNLLKGEFYE